MEKAQRKEMDQHDFRIVMDSVRKPPPLFIQALARGEVGVFKDNCAGCFTLKFSIEVLNQ